MADSPRDLIFLSYSRKDPEIYQAVRQALLNQGLADVLWDDTEIRVGERWHPKIQQGMQQAAVAVLILSDGYFARRKGGGEYILEQELPYLLERYQAESIGLLPIYWRPSAHFRPDRRDPVADFEYAWEGQPKRFNLHDIQALSRGGCLAKQDELVRHEALLDLAAEAKRLWQARVTTPASTASDQVQGRQPLSIEFNIQGGRLQRLVRLGGHPVPLPPPDITAAELTDLRRQADLPLPGTADAQGRLGRTLYRLLFGAANAEDLFPGLGEQRLGLSPGASARTRALALEITQPTPADDPWLQRLPWHLSRPDNDGESLSDCCGWTFEAVPPGVQPRIAPVLSAEPCFLLLIDRDLPGAAQHEADLAHQLEHRHGLGVELVRCVGLDQLAVACAREPQPEILYVYAKTGLDLAALAEHLGDRVPLVVLNLIGATPPAPPTELVRNRKLVVGTWSAGEDNQARDAAAQWLQAQLTDSAGIGIQRIAATAFGARLRLWSGCASLQTTPGTATDSLFRRQLIKLLLDRITARREVSDEIAAALAQGQGVLGLIAAGTDNDHPQLLPKQVWHHFQTYRDSASPDSLRRYEMDPGDLPEAETLLYLFAQRLGRGRDDWPDGLDRLADGLDLNDNLLLSLEWRLGPPLPETDPEQWRADWLGAWLDLGTRYLAGYRRTGVLLAHYLIVETDNPADAKSWTEASRDAWRQHRRGRQTQGFVYHHLEPLSLVPVEDIEHFFEKHYRLDEAYPHLDLFDLAKRIIAATGGEFAATVALVERLHDSGFQDLPPAPAPTQDPARSPSP